MLPFFKKVRFVLNLFFGAITDIATAFVIFHRFLLY